MQHRRTFDAAGNCRGWALDALAFGGSTSAHVPWTCGDSSEQTLSNLVHEKTINIENLIALQRNPIKVP